MPITAIAAVVMAVVAVAGTVMQMQAAEDQKKARNKQLEIEARQREMQRQAQDLRLKRDARMREAMVLNQAAALSKLDTSSASGAKQAIQTNLQRDLALSAQGADLASEADAVTREQISIDASRQRNAALFSGISSVAKAAGGMSFEDGDGDTGTLFGSTSGADTGDVFADQAGGLGN